jgi:hypothetical protein
MNGVSHSINASAKRYSYLQTARRRTQISPPRR